MNDKRYSVFISSTYEDLKDERRAVQDTVISAGDFPVQMESFPASDEDAFDLIKSLLANCDYYVLIIGGRYGTLADGGLSYTHKEFRYAVANNIPILVMLHGAPGKISAENTEPTQEGKERLKDFVKEASEGRTRKLWTDTGTLKAEVLSALVKAKQAKPRVGWVRGDIVASVEALEELVEVRRQNTKYREAIGDLEHALALPPIPDANDFVEIDLMPTSLVRGVTTSTGTYARLRGTWISTFPFLHGNLKWHSYDWGDEIGYTIDEEASCAAIGAELASPHTVFDSEFHYRISKNTLRRLTSYFIEVGLMSADGDKPFNDNAERTARRYHIADNSQQLFEVIAGEVHVITKVGKASTEAEIPF